MTLCIPAIYSTPATSWWGHITHSWLICCFWYHWSFHPSHWSSNLVRSWWSQLARLMSYLTLLGSLYTWFHLCILHSFLWFNPRLCTWPTTFHSLYNLVISKNSIKYHFYADDTRLYIFFTPTKFALSLESLNTTFTEILSWMNYSSIHLKPKFFLFHKKTSQIFLILQTYLSVMISSQSVPSSKIFKVSSLGSFPPPLIVYPDFESCCTHTLCPIEWY